MIESLASFELLTLKLVSLIKRYIRTLENNGRIYYVVKSEDYKRKFAQIRQNRQLLSEWTRQIGINH